MSEGTSASVILRIVQLLVAILVDPLNLLHGNVDVLRSMRRRVSRRCVRLRTRWRVIVHSRTWIGVVVLNRGWSARQRRRGTGHATISQALSLHGYEPGQVLMVVWSRRIHVKPEYVVRRVHNLDSICSRC